MCGLGKTPSDGERTVTSAGDQDKGADMRSSNGPLWNQDVDIKRISRLRTVDPMTIASCDDGAQQLVRVDRCLVADLPDMPRARR